MIIELFMALIVLKNCRKIGMDLQEWLKCSFKVTPHKIPANVELIIGLVQDTFEIFLNKNSENNIAFLHLDMDTYIPTQ